MSLLLATCIAGIASASAQSSVDTVLLDLDATRSRDSLLLVDGAKTATSLGATVSDSTTHLKFAGNGGFQLPSWTAPQGAWYVVARVRMDSYGDQASWFISDILNSSTWPDGNGNPQIQGFQFRTGGSPLYPVAGRNPAISDQVWQSTLDSYDHAYQARMSQCLAGFSIASTDPNVNWIMSNSDRCLPLGRWVHFAASWDGSRQHLFIDGVEATDTLRQLGQGLKPRIDGKMPLAFGMRGADVVDQFQFLKGGLQSVRIVSGLLDSAKALALYLADMKPVAGSCQAIPMIVSPEVGEVAVALDSVVIRLEPAPSCRPGLVPDLVLRPGDSLDVLAVSVDGKGTRLASTRTASLVFPLEKLGLETTTPVPFLLKARIVRTPVPVAARIASVEAVWGMERPMSLAGFGSTRAVRESSGSSLRVLSGSRLQAPGVSQVVARRADGRQVVLSRAPVDGIWDLSILPSGLWWISAGDRVVVLPRL